MTDEQLDTLRKRIWRRQHDGYRQLEVDMQVVISEIIQLRAENKELHAQLARQQQKDAQ